VAVAIDEEREFAMFSAYAAWKYGRRAWVVTTCSEFLKHPLWDARYERAEDLILLRDLDLRFPDIPAGEEGLREALVDIGNWQCMLSDNWHARVVTGERDVILVASRKVRSKFPRDRIFWRVGQKGLGEEMEFLGFRKPVSTLYDLSMVFGSEASEITTTTISRLGTAGSNHSYRHGAEYVNLVIAESLLRQARHCSGGVESHLLGALLASECFELLLGMSKTTALEALQEMHSAEVQAEVSFMGIDHAMRTTPRRDDLEKTLEALYCSVIEKSGASQNTRRYRSSLRRVQRVFLSQIWEDLKQIYKSAERFEAADEANLESLVNSEWFKHPWQRFAALVFGILYLIAFLYAILPQDIYSMIPVKDLVYANAIIFLPSVIS